MEIVQMNALVYGFGPYGKFAHNVTTDIIRSVNRMKRAKGMVFDVRFNQKQFIEALERYRPEMVIGLGQHPRARKIRIERRARNWQASSSTEGKRIERSGPEYCYVSLKISAAEGATVTYDAGDYVCNYSMYVMCRETEKTGAKYAFLHVPLNVDVEKATELIGKILSR